MVKSRQRKFFVKMYNDRINKCDDPFGLVLNLVLRSRYSTKNYVYDLINNGIDDIQHESVLLKNNLSNSESSRRLVYREVMNVNLSVHDIYLIKMNIPEAHRVAFTRFRVSSHSLAVETGRWNRRGRGRLPIEERLCSCGYVQSEEHVVSHCPLSQHIRDEYQFTSFTDLISERFPNEVLCKII